MKRLLISTAMGLMLTTSAFADAHSGAMMTYQSEQTGDLYASNLIGMRIYSAEADYDALTADSVMQDDAEQNWDDIGEINDVILSRDGQVKAVILGVGGFIGIGEKDVAVDMNSIKIVNESDDPGDFFLVVKTNKEALTDAPAYERQDDVAMANDTVTSADRPMLAPPAVEREGYEVATPDQLTTEDLTGARLYGAKDEDIGEIDQLIVDDNGKLQQAVLDIGGFLGIGEHRIAVAMDELKILRPAEGGDVRVYIDATKENLESQPEYEG
ncbi:PRC-barrel domain-containing protein [uncultured Roseobacter sp.]|uniref:PRC-barrel domain-containing protein n=1 Tax=uncultured Roseobacter sp. TaxID=114847 RepID=UPI002621501C|nr:PRC-barrel domain-containing protein [uncultured Roseobacter sp.]